jgi:hypothetical protein
MTIAERGEGASVQDASAAWRGRLDAYEAEGYRCVQGWMDPLSFHALRAAQACHDEFGVTGSIGEIGVHHGRFFLALMCLRCESEAAFAIDVFGEQAANVDESGRGDLAAFEQNLARFDPNHPSGVDIIESDSLQLGATSLAGRVNGERCRLLSIDGGHTAVHAAHDLRLAQEILAPGGVAFLDDAFKPSWPGVHEGLSRFMLLETPRIAPVAFIGNKLLLTTISHQVRLADWFAAAFAAERTLHVKAVEMFGWRVASASFNRQTLMRIPARELRDHERTEVESCPVGDERSADERR